MVAELCDTHCHLDMEPLSSCLPFVLASSKARGVGRFIVPGVLAAGWSRVESLSQQYSEIYYALGLHPAFVAQHHVDDVRLLADKLSRRHEKCVALGEVGLDRRCQDEAMQEKLFVLQLELAQELALPVILHSVGRHQRVLELLKAFSGVQGVVHAFSGSKEQAKQFVDLGFRLGAGSLILRSSKTRQAFKAVPLSAILLETDAPDMYLPSSLSRCGSPIDLLVILRELAVLRGVDVDQAARVFQENCENLFFLGKS